MKELQKIMMKGERKSGTVQLGSKSHYGLSNDGVAAPPPNPPPTHVPRWRVGPFYTFDTT